MPHRILFANEQDKWFWYTTDVRGRTVGRSHKGFTSKTSCQHNASVVQQGLTQGLRQLGYDR